MPSPRLPSASTAKEYISAPTGGWSPDIPTWELPANQAPQLENFQIKPGKIRVRPTYRVTADLTASAPSLAGWVQVGHSRTLLSKRLYTPSLIVEPRNLHRVGVSVPATGATTPVEAANYETIGGTTTRVATSAAFQAVGDRTVNFGTERYVLGYATAATGTYTIPFSDGINGWASGILIVEGVGVQPGSLGNANAPQGSFDIYGLQNRIWLAGGQGIQDFNAGTPGSPTALFFTNPLNNLTGATANWADPVSGLDNKIVIDNDVQDSIVGLASVPAGLIIFRENTVFILRGTDPTSYTVRPVTRETGCIDNRSIVEQDSKVYFMSEQGFMVTDGTQTLNVSGALQDELYRQVAIWTNGVFNSTGAWCTAVSMSDNKILVSFGTYSAGSSGNPYLLQSQFSGVFDPATGVWVKVSTAITPTSGGKQTLGPVIAGYGQVQSLGNTQQVTIEDSVAGRSTSSSSSLHDVTNVAGTTFTPITATWVTKSPQLALGGRDRSHIKRTYLDYAVSTGGSTGTLDMKHTDRQTGTQLNDASIAVSVNASDPRQALERDIYQGVADLGLTVTLTGGSTGAASVAKAEVHGVGLEFEQTSDMRPTV